MKKGIVLSQIVCLPLFLIVMLFLVPIKASALTQTVNLNYDELSGMLSFEIRDDYHYYLCMALEGEPLSQKRLFTSKGFEEQYVIDFIEEYYYGDSGKYEFQLLGFTNDTSLWPSNDLAVVQSNKVTIDYNKPSNQIEKPVLKELKFVKENIGERYILVEWNPVNNARSYEVQLKSNGYHYSWYTTDNFAVERVNSLTVGDEYELSVIAYSNNVQKYLDSKTVFNSKITVDSSKDVFFDGNKVEPEIKPNNYSQVRFFVNRLYKTTMGRNGESGGLEYWTEHLLAGDLTGAQAAQEFILSDEFKKKNLSYNEFLDVCYAAFFNRAGDEGGYAYWLDAMYNGGTREYVVACFVDSEEFTSICESYGIERGDLDKSKGQPTGSQEIAPLKVKSDNVNDTQLSGYVEKLYKTILGRDSEPDGCAYWMQAIKDGKGMDAGKAASQFFQSKEYKDKNKSDEEFLRDVYAMFFGREPDTEGYNYWLDNLKKEKVSRVWLIEAGFGKSDEFKGILESYGFDIEEE